MITISEADFIKRCLVTAEIVCPEKSHLFQDISLSRNAVAEWTEMAGDSSQQSKTSSPSFEPLLIRASGDFEKVEQLLHEYGLDLSKLVCFSDGATNIVGRHNGNVAKLGTKIENIYPDSTFKHFHCIIDQQNRKF